MYTYVFVPAGIKKSNGVQVAVKTLEKSSRGCSGDFALIRSEITIMAYLLEHAKETQHVVCARKYACVVRVT